MIGPLFPFSNLFNLFNAFTQRAPRFKVRRSPPVDSAPSLSAPTQRLPRKPALPVMAKAKSEKKPGYDVCRMSPCG